MLFNKLTVSQSGMNPRTDVREAKKMLDNARATFCLTCMYTEHDY